jgi:hypothetical protein
MPLSAHNVNFHSLTTSQALTVKNSLCCELYLRVVEMIISRINHNEHEGKLDCFLKFTDICNISKTTLSRTGDIHDLLSLYIVNTLFTVTYYDKMLTLTQKHKIPLFQVSNADLLPELDILFNSIQHISSKPRFFTQEAIKALRHDSTNCNFIQITNYIRVLLNPSTNQVST